MRHLHFGTDDERTLCGARRWVPVRTGSRIYRERGAVSVHISKARRSDCAECRAEYRRTIHMEREAL
jgi:hypothetical protein